MRRIPTLPKAAALVGLLCAAACPALALAQENSPTAPLFQRVIITTLGEDCAKAHPDLADEINRQRAQWLQSQSSVLGALDSQVANLPADKKAALAKLLADAAANIRNTAASEVATAEGRKTCSRLPEAFGSAGAKMYDAENLGEATGMFYQLQLMVETLGPACSSRFPGQAGTISAARSTWRDRDRSLIEVVAAQRSELRAEDGARYEQLDSSQRKSAVDSVASIMQSSAAESVCRQFFDELATGAVRKKTPRVFEILEANKPKG